MKQPGVVFRGAILLAQGMTLYIHWECSFYIFPHSSWRSSIFHITQGREEASVNQFKCWVWKNVSSLSRYKCHGKRCRKSRIHPKFITENGPLLQNYYCIKVQSISSSFLSSLIVHYSSLLVDGSSLKYPVLQKQTSMINWSWTAFTSYNWMKLRVAWKLPTEPVFRDFYLS